MNDGQEGGAQTLKAEFHYELTNRWISPKKWQVQIISEKLLSIQGPRPRVITGMIFIQEN